MARTRLMAGSILALLLASLLAGAWGCGGGDQAGNVSTTPGAGQTLGDSGISNDELEAILAGFLQEEIESLDCNCETCEGATQCLDAGLEIYRVWSEDYWQRYMIHRLGEDALEGEFDQLGKKLAACVENAFRHCGCEIECLECLLNAIYRCGEEDMESLKAMYGYGNLTDLLMGAGPMDLPWGMGAAAEDKVKEVVEAMLAKLRECGYGSGKAGGSGGGEVGQTEEGRESGEATTELDDLMEELRKKIEDRTGNETAEVQKEAEDAFRKLEDLLKGSGNESDTTDAAAETGAEAVAASTPGADATEFCE